MEAFLRAILEPIAKFIVFIKVMIFSFAEAFSKFSQEMTNPTKYKLQEFLKKDSNIVVIYSVKYTRMTLKTNLIEIFKNESILKGFSKSDMAKMFYFYAKNFCFGQSDD